MSVKTHGQRTCTVEVSPSEVDAGADLTLKVRVSCPHGCDLRGQSVAIRNQGDTELASAELTELDGEAYVTSELVLRAPLRVGEHTYRVVLAAHEKDGVSHEETSTEFSFAVKAHAASMNVWGLPSEIVAGERFKLKVGIKCSSGCKLTGRELSVFDNEGAQVGAGNLFDDVWPGTNALYFAEVEAEAPLTTGDHKWAVTTPEWDSGLPHAVGSSTFAVKVVTPPDYEVTVEAFDGQKQTPIKGANVLLHPYRALTDENGVARVKVAKGTYRLQVSGSTYVAYQNTIDVAGDVTTRAELTEGPDDDPALYN